ncbi:3-oxoacyl-[acyl-carrier-protein] synthase III [Pseudomonas chlororaphis]
MSAAPVRWSGYSAVYYWEAVMIGIKSIASYVPVAGVDNYAQGAKFEKDEEFILGKIGSAFLPRKDATQETSDLCVEAVNALFANNPQLSRESIDALIVVTQNGDEEGLPHTAAIVQDKLGLPTHVARPSIFPWAAPVMSMASTRSRASWKPRA